MPRLDRKVLEAAISRTFYLDVDGTVRRRSDGNSPTSGSKRDRGYAQVWVYREDGGRHLVGYHRVVFFLHKGFVPDRVDHKDRDQSNNLPGNLRAATHRQNLANVLRAPRGLPKGVRQRKSGRYQAYMDGGQSLGTFDTIEEAHMASSKARRERYGDFYVE